MLPSCRKVFKRVNRINADNFTRLNSFRRRRLRGRFAPHLMDASIEEDLSALVQQFEQQEKSPRFAL